MGDRVLVSRRHRLALCAAAAVVLVSAVGADPADARGRRKRSWSSYHPPYAAIVVDANTGKVLHAASADATRHPASLTKIMTLYLLFEHLEAGKVKLDTPLKVSEHAASQAPSKLGLKPGQTITAEDAIKALVTKSANDAAVVIAEALAGSEDEFAKRMTRKARALGMARTNYANASGLPDPEQVTSAQDQATLGRAIQDRFPRQYKYFATPSFYYRGVAIRNHNKLLGRVTGVDGIKTGYTRASGFNLVSSIRRGNRHVVAVVLGGASGAQRDARMRALLDTHIEVASTQRTATRIAEAEPRAPRKGAEANGGGMRLASATSRPVTLPAAAPPPAEAPVAVAPEPQATASLVTTAREDALPTGTIPAGTDTPLQPLSVKTVPVRAFAASAMSLRLASAASTQVAPAPQPAPAARAMAQPAATPPAPSPIAAVVARPIAPQPVSALPMMPPQAPPQAPSSATARPAADVHAAEAGAAHRAATKGDWMIQVGAFPDETQAKERLRTAQTIAKALLAKADPHTERVLKGSQELYRARFVGLDQGTAETACKHFKRNDIACMTLKN